MSTASGPTRHSGAPGVALIGCGRVTESWHLPALRDIGATVAAVADVDAARLARVADRFGVKRRALDHRELLDDPAIEVVAVCVPVLAHAEVALAALEAGKHVLIEKPLALSLDECDALVEAAARSRGRVTVGFNLRGHRLLRRAREIVRSGEIGELKLIRGAHSSNSRFRTNQPEWRWDRDRGGGVLIEHAIHSLDLWRFMAGEDIEEAFAVAAGPDESAIVTARTSSGVPIAGEFSDVSAQVNEIDLYGSDALLRVDCYRFDGLEVLPRDATAGDLGNRLRRLPALARELPRAVASMRAGGDFVESYRAEWRKFLTAIRDGGPVECTAEDGRHATQLLLAILHSTATGRPVKVAEAPREPALAAAGAVPAWQGPATE